MMNNRSTGAGKSGPRFKYVRSVLVILIIAASTLSLLALAHIQGKGPKWTGERTSPMQEQSDRWTAIQAAVAEGRLHRATFALG